MMDFDGAESPKWRIDPITGYRTYTVDESGRTENLLNFVGVGYGINGTLTGSPISGSQNQIAGLIIDM